MKRFSALLVGVIFILLGLLWFLQGSDIIHVQPILCFADCETITGRSLLWQVIGAIVFIIGITLIGFLTKGRLSHGKNPKDGV